MPPRAALRVAALSPTLAGPRGAVKADGGGGRRGRATPTAPCHRGGTAAGNGGAMADPAAAAAGDGGPRQPPPRARRVSLVPVGVGGGGDARGRPRAVGTRVGGQRRHGARRRGGGGGPPPAAVTPDADGNASRRWRGEEHTKGGTDLEWALPTK